MALPCVWALSFCSMMHAYWPLFHLRLQGRLCPMKLALQLLHFCLLVLPIYDGHSMPPELISALPLLFHKFLMRMFALPLCILYLAGDGIQL
mmetsp:Transcript_15915/g.45493  ORF Transcript_15915/g.45493 Transcript_15915/m.45493 type:complete len:92 (-) Transcript_15915:348-623(-)